MKRGDTRTFFKVMFGLNGTVPVAVIDAEDPVGKLTVDINEGFV